MWNEIKNIKSGKKELREFGLTIGIILVILGAIAAWRGKPSSPYLLTFGVIFTGFGVALPSALKPLQKIWMGLAVILGFFVSRVVLFLFFYAVVTPIGLVTRILGTDILDQRIDKSKVSYWVEKKVTPGKESYLNQY